MNPQEKRDAAAWTARWCRLVELHVEQLESLRPDDGVRAYHDVDTLGLGLFSALHKMRKGAAVVLGEDHSAVQAFDAEYPHLRDARNVLEHFDEYSRGVGKLQKKAKHPKQLSQIKISINGVFGEDAIHRLSFMLVSEGRPDLGPYDLDTRAVVEAARQLCDVAIAEATGEVGRSGSLPEMRVEVPIVDS